MPLPKSMVGMVGYGGQWLPDYGAKNMPSLQTWKVEPINNNRNGFA